MATALFLANADVGRWLSEIGRLCHANDRVVCEISTHVWIGLRKDGIWKCGLFIRYIVKCSCATILPSILGYDEACQHFNMFMFWRFEEFHWTVSLYSNYALIPRQGMCSRVICLFWCLNSFFTSQIYLVEWNVSRHDQSSGLLRDQRSVNN